MKTKQYITAVLGAAIMGLCNTSCMDLDPQADLGDDYVWSSADNIQLFANQFYAYSANFANRISDAPHSDYRSDLMFSTSLNTYQQGTNTIPTSDSNYTTAYTRIYNTNLLLKNAASFGDQDAISTPIGEAYFFRAYAYFELLQLYGDAIITTEPLDLDSEELYTSRNDRSEVVDLIVSDLQLAASYLPETASEEGRLTQDAAWAMLSRAALYEGTWQKFHTNGATTTSNTTRSAELLEIAADAAKQVMDNGNYSIFYNSTLGDQSYRYMFILEDTQCNPAGLQKSANTEYIFSYRYRYGYSQSLNVTHALLGSCYLTRKLANMYLCSDGLPVEVSSQFQGYSGTNTEYTNRDNRMTNTLLQHGASYWNNDGTWRTTWTDSDYSSCLTADVRSYSGYADYKWGIERECDDYYESMDYPVIRYAEVLLNYAEAMYELNGSITDSQLDASLNLVRLRVNQNMPALSNSLVSTYGLDMREEIRRERTVELFLEGFRIDDLKRWYTAVDEMNENQLGVQWDGTAWETTWTNQTNPIDNDGCIVIYDNKSWTEKNYLYPLPSDQMQLNSQLNQNPGWE